MTERLGISPRAHAPNSRSSTPLSDLSTLDRAALPSDTIALARFLIGAYLVREPRAEYEANSPCQERVVVRIIETEAYLVGDPGSHAFRGQTPRNAAMFLERGHAYVYFIYGNHYCLNVVSEGVGIGAAVLIRAAEPVRGAQTLRLRSGPAVVQRDLVRGPGRLARALAIDRKFDGADLCARGALWLATRRYNGVGEHAPEPEIGTSVRIGLTKNAEAELRFFERGNPLVSGPKRLAAN
jgi:DNA-3-methyladenine glycosylase